MGVIRVEGVWRGGYKALGSRKGCGCVDGGGCRTGLRVWSGRHQCRAVRLHRVALRVWSEDCRGTVRVWEDHSVQG